MSFHGWNEGDTIPLDLMAVSWSDGDIAQIRNIVTPESLEVYRNNMITANKQNPQRTGTEQPADLTKCFPLLEYLQRGNSLENVPTERHPMKLLITAAFARLAKEGRLVLKPTKSKALIDFISCQPQVSTKALTRDNIMHGFFEAGYIDKVKF